MAKYSLLLTPTLCRVAGCIKSIRPIRIRALAALTTQLARAYKAGNIAETVEDRAKTTINGLYKVVHGLSIAAKMYDLE